MADILPIALPGERVVDNQLVSGLVEAINSKHARRSLELALEIGQLVVDHLFNGNLSLAEARARGHASYRALAERDDLALSHSRLHKCVRVLVHVHQLGPELTERLTFSHHVALLPVRDLRDRQALARKAAAKGWTSRELRVEAQRLHRKATGHRPGRPPLPDFMKQLRAVVRYSEQATETLPPVADIHQVKPDQARELLVELDRQLDRLQHLRDHVVARLGARSAQSSAPRWQG